MRVKILHNDRRCWLKINEDEIETIKDLINLFKLRFNIQGEFFITIDDAELPECEHIDIIKNEDILKIINVDGKDDLESRLYCKLQSVIKAQLDNHHDSILIHVKKYFDDCLAKCLNKIVFMEDDLKNLTIIKDNKKEKQLISPTKKSKKIKTLPNDSLTVLKCQALDKIKAFKALEDKSHLNKKELEKNSELLFEPPQTKKLRLNEKKWRNIKKREGTVTFNETNSSILQSTKKHIVFDDSEDDDKAVPKEKNLHVYSLKADKPSIPNVTRKVNNVWAFEGRPKIICPEMGVVQEINGDSIVDFKRGTKIFRRDQKAYKNSLYASQENEIFSFDENIDIKKLPDISVADLDCAEYEIILENARKPDRQDKSLIKTPSKSNHKAQADEIIEKLPKSLEYTGNNIDIPIKTTQISTPSMVTNEIKKGGSISSYTKRKGKISHKSTAHFLGQLFATPTNEKISKPSDDLERNHKDINNVSQTCETLNNENNVNNSATKMQIKPVEKSFQTRQQSHISLGINSNKGKKGIANGHINQMDLSSFSDNDKDDSFIENPQKFRRMGKGAPQIGKKIRFRLLEMDDNYNPVVSKFKEALILDYDHTAKIIDLEILNGSPKRRRRTCGKFDIKPLSDPDEDNEIETDKNDFLDSYNVNEGKIRIEWERLIEPHILVH